MNRTGSRVGQADKALAEPFKHADALKAAQADSARIDQLMADAAKPEEPALPDPRPMSTPHGGQAVEFGHDQGVPVSAGGQRFPESRPCPVGAGEALVGECLVRCHSQSEKGVLLGG